jgi:hypothetical protein
MLAQTTTTVAPSYARGNPELFDPYTVAWIIWIALFLVIEGMALANKAPGDTLSEHVWKWFRTDVEPANRTLQDWLLRGILLGFLLWLCLHFLFGW